MYILRLAFGLGEQVHGRPGLKSGRDTRESLFGQYHTKCPEKSVFTIFYLRIPRELDIWLVAHDFNSQ